MLTYDRGGISLKQFYMPQYHILAALVTNYNVWALYPLFQWVYIAQGWQKKKKKSYHTGAMVFSCVVKNWSINPNGFFPSSLSQIITLKPEGDTPCHSSLNIKATHHNNRGVLTIRAKFDVVKTVNFLFK